MNNYISKDSCSIEIAGIGRRSYSNSIVGRADLVQDLTGVDNQLLEAINKIWGDSPTVKIPELTFDEQKTQKKAEIASSRYEKETGGITVSGATIDTDRDSQALITGAALAAVIDSAYELNWKTASGFVHLTAPEILAIAQAVRAHVQACFDREGELVALVDAAETKEDLDEIIISWPV